MASVIKIAKEPASDRVRIVYVGIECLPDIMTVMENAFPSTYGESWNVDQSRSMLALPGSRMLAAYADEQLCGFAISRSIASEEELLMIAVDPGFRDNGIGRQLLDRLLHEARMRKVKTVFLEVRANNPARRLYEKMGFKNVGRRANYYTGDKKEKFDAITFRQRLVPKS